MNRYGNFNLGSVQSQSVNHESQASNSIGSTNPYSRRDSLSHEPNMEYSQTSSGFSRISAAATRAGRSFPGTPWTEEEHKLFLLGLQKVGKGDWRGISRNFVMTRTPTQVASHARKYFLRESNLNRRRRRSSLFDLITDSEPNMDFQESSGFSHTPVATQMKKNAEKLQLSCDNDDSENIDIQNFIRILQGCTYSNNIELDKEDSSNQLESLKLTLALPIPKDNTHIQNEITSTSIKRDQPKRSRLRQKESLETIIEKIGNLDQASPNYVEEPNMDFQKSSGFSHTLVATQRKKISEKLQLSCDSDDSENTNIQNFIPTLQGCTYSNNIELDKEDSLKLLESLKLTLALPIPKDNTHSQNENTSTSIQVDNEAFDTLND